MDEPKSHVETQEDLSCDHVQFYVPDLRVAAAELINQYGFVPVHPGLHTALGRRPSPTSVVLAQGSAVLVLTQPPPVGRGSEFLRRHGTGVGRIGFRCRDARATYRRAVAHGAQVIDPLRDHGYAVTAAVRGVGDVVHTLIQRPAGASTTLVPGVAEIPAGAVETPAGLLGIDHLALCLPAGELSTAVEHYRLAWGFDKIHDERIQVGSLAMTSSVVASAGRGVVLTLIEPAGDDGGQISRFLRDNGGMGVQHLAFRTRDIVATVTELARRGVDFATTPPSYYAGLLERVGSIRHTPGRLAQLGILADRDHGGELYQIFARSTHSRGTYFAEIIERDGASGFGSNNIRALFEAKQREIDAAAPARIA